MKTSQLSRIGRPCFCCCLLVIVSAMMSTTRSARSKSSKETVASSSVGVAAVPSTEPPPPPPPLHNGRRNSHHNVHHRNHNHHHRNHQMFEQKVHLQKDTVSGRTLLLDGDHHHFDSAENESELALLDGNLMQSSDGDVVVEKSSGGGGGAPAKQEQLRQSSTRGRGKSGGTAAAAKEQHTDTESGTETGGGGGQHYPNYDRPYIASNCSRCRMLEETINLTKEAIKQQILSKLGLKQPPNITGRVLPRIPPLNHLLDMYGMQSDAPAVQAFKAGPVFEEAEDDYHAKTEKVISFAQEPPKSWSLPSNMEVQYFKFSNSVMVNKVIRTNLWVYLAPSKAVHDGGTLVHVYKVSRTESGGNTVMTHVLSSKVHDLKPRRGGWVAVDIRKLAFEWFRHPHTNLGIVVQAFDQEGLQLVTNGHQSNSDPSLTPFVEVYTMDESKRRTKRMIGLNCEENSNEVRCCRYPLTVDFEEFGWDWIIAPKKYEANYCSGECPFVFLQKYPHTHLVQQANPSGSAGPCCAPRKMSPISMLYFDNEYNIIYGLLPGMVVDRCSCS